MVHMVSVATPQYYYNMKSATNNVYTNGPGYILLKHLFKNRLWPELFSKAAIYECPILKQLECQS